MTFDDFLKSCEQIGNVKCFPLYPDPQARYSDMANPIFEKEWKEEHVDWANWVINISSNAMSSGYSKLEEQNKWCEYNLIGQYDLIVPIYFELEEDLILFSLRWL